MSAVHAIILVLLALSLAPVPPVPSPGPNQPPYVPVIEGPSAITVLLGVNVTLTATTHDPETTDTLHWTWYWGDGTTSLDIGNATNPVSTYGHIWSSVGTYFVNVTVSDGWSGPIPCPSPISVTVVAPLPGTLKGTILATDLSPIRGAEVTVSPGGHRATTNESGGYALVLGPGTYSVTVSAFGFETGTKTGRVVDSEGVTTVDFTLLPIPGMIAGTVRSAAGAPLSDATVIIAPAASQDLIVGYMVKTDSRGAFAQSVLFGTYSVTVFAPGYLQQNRTGVLVSPGGTVTLDFSMAPESSPTSTLSLPAVLAMGGVGIIAGLVAVLLLRRNKSA